MRPDGPVTDLTETQKRFAKIAGVPADRPGLGEEYPKMVYRPGTNPRHHLLDKPLPIGNGKVAGEKLSPGFDCETALVDSADDEAQALADGWFLSPDPAAQAAEVEKRNAERAKDDEIAALKAQLANQGEKRGPGRPPRAPELMEADNG